MSRLLKPSSEMSESEKAGTYELLSLFAWVAVGILFVNVSYFIGTDVGGEVYRSSGDVIPVLQAFGTGLLKASPTILIAIAMLDFAFFFQRCGKGDMFSERNVATLRSGADSLIGAAIMSAIVAPAILGAMNEPGTHEVLRFTDLALGVGLMGIALHGFAGVMRDAVAIKKENDEFV